MKLKLFSALALVAMLISTIGGAALTASAAGTATVTTGPTPVISTVPGATITVPILVNSSNEMRAFQFDLAFDPTRLQVHGANLAAQRASITDGGFLGGNAQGNASANANAPTINNVTGSITGISYYLQGGTAGAGYGATGSGTLVNIVFDVIGTGAITAPNGKAPFTLQNVILADDNSAPFSNVTLNNKYVQVGPGPNLQITALGFTPHGTGTTFDIVYTVTNNGGSASDPDTVSMSVTGATPASATHALASLAQGASASFTDANETLTGVNAAVTVSLVTFGGSRNATYSNVTSNGTTPIDANFGAFLHLTAPLTATFPTLHLGQNQIDDGPMNVQSNTNYAVTVQDANPTAGAQAGHMTEYNGTAFVAPYRQLADALKIASPLVPTGLFLSGAPQQIQTGGVAGQVGDAGQNFDITFAQGLHYADALLPTGETYHVVALFNAYVTL